MNRAKLKFSKIITTTSRVSVSNIKTSPRERVCWGLVLKCYELRTRQHKMLNVNVLRPTKHYSLGDNGPWTKVDGNTITKVIPS